MKVYITETEKIEVKTSHENKEIIKFYREFYRKPLSEFAEKLFYTDYNHRSRI